MSQTCTCENCELKGLFYKNIDEFKIDEICTQKVEHSYKKGEVIIKSGDPIDNFVYLKEGLVKLYRESDNGNEQIFTFAKPFDFVSLLTVFSYDTHQYSVAAIEPSITCSLTMDSLNELIANNNLFTQSLLRKMSAVSDKVIRESLEIKQKNLKGRVAYMLMFFSTVIYKSHHFALPISRKEMANFIGMSTENVIRAMSEFKREETIGIFGKHIEIIDFERLKQIAEHG